MRSIIAVLLVMMMALAVSASEQRVVAGPYVISFDLGTAEKYTIDKIGPAIGKPVQIEPGLWNKADTYSFNILGANNTRDLVSLTRWENSSDATISKELTIQKLGAQLLGYGVSSEGFVDIDGRVGYAMILENRAKQVIHTAWYWLDSALVQGSVVSTGKTQMVVAGNLTRSEAANLLRTIHVNAGSDDVISST